MSAHELTCLCSRAALTKRLIPANLFNDQA